MHLVRYKLALLASIALSGCALLPRIADPQVVSLATKINTEASVFFTGLAAKPSPDCAFRANADTYDQLAVLADALKQHLAATAASPAMVQASAALSRTIADARTSHALASARTNDPGGVCMVPGTIALNAEAVARASAAIAATQAATGGQ